MLQLLVLISLLLQTLHSVTMCRHHKWKIYETQTIIVCLAGEVNISHSCSSHVFSEAEASIERVIIEIVKARITVPSTEAKGTLP